MKILETIFKWFFDLLKAKEENKVLKAELKRLRASKRKLEKEIATLRKNE